MAPYASTSALSIVTAPCHYLVNVDHWHFKAVFLMLDGDNRGQWEGSVVLRRVLFVLISFPFMKLMGFEIGGFISSVLIHIAAFIAFIYFCKRKFGSPTCIVAMWLLALYPGVYYWAALPYAYAFIVPGSLIGMIILWRFSDEQDIKVICVLSVVMGVLFLGYDLFPFFGLATILILVSGKRYRLIPVVIALLSLPSIVWDQILSRVFRVPLLNPNTAVYPTIIASYFRKPDWPQWYALLRDFPKITWENYFFSNFLFLPALFTALVLLGIIWGRNRFALPESSLLVAGLLVYLFLNLAPPYGPWRPGWSNWQLRGVWMARLYQPVFVALLTFSSRHIVAYWQEYKRAVGIAAAGLLAAALVGNFRVSFGPVLHNHFSSHIYHRFYQHDNSEMLYDMISKYGRRPLGFCNPNIPPAESSVKL
jgi:hypothetical protein